LGRSTGWKNTLPYSPLDKEALETSKLGILGPLYFPFYLLLGYFSRFPFFWDFSGEFCLPQFDPEFFGHTGISSKWLVGILDWLITSLLRM
jgi:hypothetical protein